jgi:Cu/Ag efflux protein CusF
MAIVKMVGEPTFTDSFKVQHGLAVRALKAGDKVVFTAAQVGGVWAATKIQKQ